MEIENLSIPHSGIYRRGVSPSKFPQAFLPTVPNLQRKMSSMKDNYLMAINKSNRSVSTKRNDKLDRRRCRVQVGATNRCRLSEFSTGCDLLARNQMLKATQVVKREKEIYLTSLPSRSTISLQYSKSTQQNCSALDHSSLHTQPRRNAFSKKNFNVSLERRIAEMRLCENYVAFERRVPTPNDIFIKTVQDFHKKKKPDVILYALDAAWELCEDAIHESEFLSNLIKDQSSLSMRTSRENITHQDSMISPYVDEDGKMCLSLQINNPLITVEVLSIALLSLYKSLSVLPVEDVINVMVAAQLLKITRLIQLCTDVMMSSIKVNTVGLYHKIAAEYQISELSKECFSWLELKLVPFLSNEIYLGHISKDLMLQVLSSPRLFVTDEFSLLKILCYWVFFSQQQIITMPSWTTIVTWFMSIPYSKPFLQTNEGRSFVPHFKLLRLNGIIDPSSMHEIQKMNLLPVQWILSILQNHYYSLQSGGDMNLMARFENNSLRFGNILKRNTSQHSRIVALHGFYFELISIREEGFVKCYIKRLRPTSSLLSFRICERQTFSIRQDREIRYDIKLQWKTLNGFGLDSLGSTTQVVGFNERTSESQKLISKVPNTDLFVSFVLFFPPS